MKTTTDTRPLAERITQSRLETQVNHARLTPQGTPTVQVFDDTRCNVAVFVNESDSEIFTDAMNTAHRTRRTPSELAVERDELLKRVEELEKSLEMLADDIEMEAENKGRICTLTIDARETLERKPAHA